MYRSNNRILKKTVWLENRSVTSISIVSYRISDRVAKLP